LLRAREERLRDLGGLMLEMYRRDQFRQELLIERCDELIALDERLQELETLLAVAVSSRRAPAAMRCTCGAPVAGGTHFCANCGRPVSAAPVVVACATCSAPLAGDAKFCPACGSPVTAETPAPAPVREALPAAGESWES
jgi:predicted amidophosphoribosyltransferase